MRLSHPFRGPAVPLPDESPARRPPVEEVSLSALSGFRILEVGECTGVEYAGKLLADLGAEVIKIEPPGGAGSRHIPPFYDDDEHPDRSIHFWYYNTSKRSVAIDLADEMEHDRLRELASAAHAIIDGGATSLFDMPFFSALMEQLPGKAVCRVTEFGSSGPWSTYRASDLTHLALGGVMASCGYDQGATPIAPSGGQSDHITGANIAMGVLAALLTPSERSDDRHLEVSAHDCVTMSTEMSFTYGEHQQVTPRRQTGRHARPYPTAPWNHRCKDGAYLTCLPLYLTDDRYRAMIEWFDSFGLAGDLAQERFATRDQRTEHLDEVIAVIAEFCSHFDSDFLFHEAQQRRLPWARVNHAWDLLDDDHFVSRGSFVRVEHAAHHTELVYPGAPYQFSRTPWRISAAAPLLHDNDGEQRGSAHA